MRYRILVFAVLLASLTYLDRVCISLTAPLMMKDLGLSQIQMSFVFSAFTLAFGIFDIPTGWWGDKVRTRRVLTHIVLWWSTFTMLTGGAFNYPWLLITRFLFGAGEAIFRSECCHAGSRVRVPHCTSSEDFRSWEVR